MLPTRQGSLRLFRFAGIDVFVHWSWFLVAAYEIQQRVGRYSTPIWNVLEYVALFFIVLLHEFGHALACRKVGGEADQIVLWPLGGVAYVAPPPRPGATLWTIAAGPLVNAVLVPVLFGLALSLRLLGAGANPDPQIFIGTVAWINLGLLIFNLLPVYPLDGGQILRALLWYGVGRARSLLIVSIVGFVGVGALLVWALIVQSWWIGIISLFLLLRCRAALLQARLIAKMEEAGRL